MQKIHKKQEEEIHDGFKSTIQGLKELGINSHMDILLHQATYYHGVVRALLVVGIEAPPIWRETLSKGELINK